MTNQEIPIPEGYVEVPAGQFASLAQYKCARCGAVFVATHYTSQRMATGRTVTHCGTAAWWIRNVKRKSLKFVVLEHGKDYPHETCVKHEFQYYFEVLELLKEAKQDVEHGKVFEIQAEED